MFKRGTFDLDASIEKETSRHVKKIKLKPIPEIGVKEPLILLTSILEDKTEKGNKTGLAKEKKLEAEIVKSDTKVIEVVPPVKTDTKVMETTEKEPVKLSKKQKRLRERFTEEVLNPLLPENAVAVIYTDGSLVSTKRYTEETVDSGGYAAILILRNMGDVEIMLSGHKARPSSAEYMELMAINKALKRLKKYRFRGKVVLYSDALPVVNDFNTKLAGWKDCGWKKESGKYIRNWKLWKKIWKKSKKIDLRICWVKGHAESVYNNRCDVVARAEARLGAV